MVCDYKIHFYNNSVFSVLQPADVTACELTSTSQNTAPIVIELGLTATITMFVGMCFLLLVLGRSCSKIYVDWFRLVLYYVIGTLAVPLSIALGPSHGGFNRIASFGVMIHNLSEWFIMNRMWVGQKKTNQLGSVMYVSLFLIAITALPLQPLFYIAMIQGAFCDWTLVFSFLYLQIWLKKQKLADAPGDPVCHSWIGFAAALLHILSIQPLFFGMALAYSTLSGITIVLLLPTFVLYTYFASNGLGPHQKANIVAPTFYNAQFVLTKGIYNTLQEMATVPPAPAPVVGGGGAGIGSVDVDSVGASPAEQETLLVDTEAETEADANAANTNTDVAHNKEAKMDSGAAADADTNTITITSTAVAKAKGKPYNIQLAALHNRTGVANAGPNSQSMNSVDNQFNESLKKNIFLDVMYNGMIGLDPANSKMRTILWISALVTSIVNSSIVFFSPCYINAKKLVCN